MYYMRAESILNLKKGKKRNIIMRNWEETFVGVSRWDDCKRTLMSGFKFFHKIYTFTFAALYTMKILNAIYAKLTSLILMCNISMITYILFSNKIITYVHMYKLKIIITYLIFLNIILWQLSNIGQMLVFGVHKNVFFNLCTCHNFKVMKDIVTQNFVLIL